MTARPMLLDPGLELTLRPMRYPRFFEMYRDAIRNNKASLQLLETDPENLERYAREEHLMKRDNEDVYVIVDAAKPAEE